jgi:hypothetical protein
MTLDSKVIYAYEAFAPKTFFIFDKRNGEPVQMKHHSKLYFRIFSPKTENVSLQFLKSVQNLSIICMNNFYGCLSRPRFLNSN